MRDLPSGKRLQFAIEAMAIVSVVDLPIFIAWWIFPVRFLLTFTRPGRHDKKKTSNMVKISHPGWKGSQLYGMKHNHPRIWSNFKGNFMGINEELSWISWLEFIFILDWMVTLRTKDGDVMGIKWGYKAEDDFWMVTFVGFYHKQREIHWKLTGLSFMGLDNWTQWDIFYVNLTWVV